MGRYGKDKSQCVWGCLGVPSFLGTVSMLFNAGSIFTHIYIYIYVYRYTVLRLYIPKISKNHTDYIHTRKLSQAISVFIFFRYLFSNRTITFAGAAHCIPKAFAKETPCIDIVSPLNYSKWKNHMPYLKLLKPITWSPTEPEPRSHAQVNAVQHCTADSCIIAACRAIKQTNSIADVAGTFQILFAPKWCVVWVSSKATPKN